MVGPARAENSRVCGQMGDRSCNPKACCPACCGGSAAKGNKSIPMHSHRSSRAVLPARCVTSSGCCWSRPFLACSTIFCRLRAGFPGCFELVGGGKIYSVPRKGRNKKNPAFPGARAPVQIGTVKSAIFTGILHGYIGGYLLFGPDNSGLSKFYQDEMREARKCWLIFTCCPVENLKPRTRPGQKTGVSDQCRYIGLVQTLWHSINLLMQCK